MKYGFNTCYGLTYICTLSIFSSKTCLSVKKYLLVHNWVLRDKSGPEGRTQQHLPCQAAHDSSVGSEAACANWPANQLHNM